MPMVPPVDGVLHTGEWSDAPFVRDAGIRCRLLCRPDFLRNSLQPKPLYGVNECEMVSEVPSNAPNRLPCKFRRWQNDVYGVYRQLVRISRGYVVEISRRYAEYPLVYYQNVSRREQECHTKCKGNADKSRLLVKFYERIAPLKHETDRVTPMYEAKHKMYQTTNEVYGMNWETNNVFRNSISQSTPYRQLNNTRRITEEQVPPSRTALQNCHNPTHPCNIVTVSNLPVNTAGKFTNYRRDLYSNSQGLWSNASFNRQRATADNQLGTYSNLQGGWARVGPTTYRSTHYDGDLVPDWMTYSYEQPEKRTYTDANNKARTNLFVESGWR